VKLLAVWVQEGYLLSNICYTSGKTGNSVHMNLASRSFLGFLIDPLGRHPRSLTLQDKGIAARGAGSPWIGLESIATRPLVRKGLFSSSLALDLGGGRNLTLPAVDAFAARTFADAAATAWTDFNRAELEAEDAAVRRILQALDALTVPDAYPAACQVAPLARDAVDLNSRVLSKLNAEAVGDKVMSRIAPIKAFASDPNAIRDAAIDAFVEAQLLRWKEFFDTVESMPLTPEQRLSVVVDEDATLVLAGAGSARPALSPPRQPISSRRGSESRASSCFWLLRKTQRPRCRSGSKPGAVSRSRHAPSTHWPMRSSAK